MSGWFPMDAAPQDGTWILAENEDGDTARVQSRPIVPQIPDMLGWFVGEPEKQGHWMVGHCFYPVRWKPL